MAFRLFATPRRYLSAKFVKPSWIRYGAAKHGDFTQREPQLGNQYLEDGPLLRALRRSVPREVLSEIEPDLTLFGERVPVEIEALGRECEKFPPKLTHQNAWGERIQELWTCEAWKEQRIIAAEEGLVATAYERKHGEWSRLHQLVKLYLYAPSAGLYTCPLAMTDGASSTIEALKLAENFPQMKHAFERLTSRHPDKFWTSGQWMTERRGGSDVANGTDTIAVRDPSLPEKHYRLYGYKWFSSATDADMSLTLARVATADGKVDEGNKGLSLFFLKVRDENDRLNNIHMVRLKEKLGTRQLPTAELLLDGVEAIQLTEPGRGISGISNMLNITRVYNSVCSVAPMRRLLNLARDYAENREVFGARIMDHPLHVHTLSEMEVEHRGCVLLMVRAGEWLGKRECGTATDEEQLLLRLLIPVMKLYTAKQGVSVSSELLEAFGGQGYMEDSGLPCFLRDAQVLPIWEGTTNILSLDVLRALHKSQGEALRAFAHSVAESLSGAELHSDENLRKSALTVQKAVEDIVDFATNNQDIIQLAARDLAYSIARTYIGGLLVQQACSRETLPHQVWAASRWCLGRDLCPVRTSQENGFYSIESYQSSQKMLQPAVNT
ncbi:acyl-CoA dehydrogenase family member 11-like [Galendromus occidentalis]|uniref:Acyl-CoA dehydrogenase family member 11-like n=1 Tax=Galendromus occidentalis TaxID=34638 RepID=A0AAJ6QVZ7_9ACAR|nr:acyl-CoA dehydrogenase family member 11-like [Galendromus occidentalis]